MASRPAAPRPCSTFSRHWKWPASSSSARDGWAGNPNPRHFNAQRMRRRYFRRSAPNRINRALDKRTDREYAEMDGGRRRTIYNMPAIGVFRCRRGLPRLQRQ
jgi:hypothetical protein